MKMNRLLGNILFLLTLASPMLSFYCACTLGEADTLGMAGMLKYTWIMWLFIPIGVLSILVGMKLKKAGESYKKNLIIAFICIPLIAIYGSYRFIADDSLSYDTEKITVIEDITGITLPSKMKVGAFDWSTYTENYAKITDDESKKIFEQELSTNDLWQNNLSTAIRGLLPVTNQHEAELYDYFVFYNITNNEYNIYPQPGEYECIFIAYRCETQTFLILDNYIVTVK